MRRWRARRDEASLAEGSKEGLNRSPCQILEWEILPLPLPKLETYHILPLTPVFSSDGHPPCGDYF